MDDSELTVGKDYLVKLGTKLIPGVLSSIRYAVDINTSIFLLISSQRTALRAVI